MQHDDTESEAFLTPQSVSLPDEELPPPLLSLRARLWLPSFLCRFLLFSLLLPLRLAFFSFLRLQGTWQTRDTIKTAAKSEQEHLMQGREAQLCVPRHQSWQRGTAQHTCRASPSSPSCPF